MATTPMARVRTVVTGVAGSPYYLVGYFEYLEGDQTPVIEAWSDFTSVNAGAQPLGSVWTTEGEVDVVDPVSGDIIALASGTSVTIAGTANIPLQAPTVQALVQWRTGVYVGGREIRGRTNIPCQFQQNANAAGGVAATYRGDLATRADVLVDQTVAELVIWSKKNGRHERVINSSVWSQFSVLRSRRD